MILDKTLLIKGIVGVGAVGGVATVGVAAHRAGLFSSEETKRLNVINKKLSKLGLGSCSMSYGDLQESSKLFSKSCELSKDQFKTIKFSNLGDGDLTLGSWTDDNQKVTLKVEEKSLEDKSLKFTFTTLPSSSPLTVTGGGRSINIKQNEEYREKNGRLSRVINEALRTKLGEYNEKIKNLNIPDSCKFNVESGDTTKECEVTQGEFKNIKFSNKTDNIELIVKGWSDNNAKMKLKVDEKDESAKTLKYTFSGMPSKVTVFGDKSKGKIVIDTTKDYVFEEESGKLSKTSTNKQSILTTFNSNLGTLNIPVDCRFDEAETDTSVECELTQDQLKTINFSNKGSGNLTVKGWPSAGNVKLKVEKDTADQQMKISFPELTSQFTIFGEGTKGKVIVKNDKKFKFENEKLVKESTNDSPTITRLEGYNTNLGKLNLPDECKFDVYESDKTTECDISKEEFKKVKFWNKDGDNPLTIGDETNFNSVKLEAKEETKSSTNKLKIIIKNTSKTVKITGGSNSFNLRKSNDDEFEIRNEKLAQVRKGIDNEGSSLGLTCTYTGDGNNGTCKASSGGTVKVLASSTDTSGSVSISDTSSNIFNFFEYEDGYNLMTKFTYIGTTTPTGSTGPKLENNANYQTVNKENNQKYLVKKNK